MNQRLSALMSIARGESVELPPLPALTRRRVEPSGPFNALIAVIGEAGGKEEAETGIPFVGKSGKLLREQARYAGISLHTCYLDNVYPYYPPNGKIKNIPADELEQATQELCERLHTLTDVRVIVPTGNIALKALLGLEGITKHRGSIYKVDTLGYPVKVIPIIHPAAILRGQKQWMRRGCLDWVRIAEEAKRAILSKVSRFCNANPRESRLQDVYNRMLPLCNNRKCTGLALDIETKPSEGRILCVSFAISIEWSITLEWNEKYIPWIRKFCELPIDKVLWNHLYDYWYLIRAGIKKTGRILDGMTMLHAMQPTDNVSLAFAASIETKEPYWKDESKDEDDKTAEQNWDKFKQYCGTDSMVTLEIVNRLINRLEEQGLTQFHHEHYEELAEPMLDLMLRGVRIDHENRKSSYASLRQEAVEARDKLAEFNDGEPLFTLSTKRDKLVWEEMHLGLIPGSATGYSLADIHKSLDTINAKNVSTAKLKNLLYNKYDLPIQMKRRENGEETETLDVFALRKFRYDYRDNAEVSQIIDLAIQHTKAQKLATFITDNKYDDDGRMRFSLKVTTEAGRLSSSASPHGRKVNSQNIPRDKRIRSLILPEEGHIILQVDGSAAEARCCFVRTKDPELMNLAGLRSDVYDQHKHTGVICGFAENEEMVTKSQRQVCKNVSHGAQRDMGGYTLAQTILREALVDDLGEVIVYSEEFCDAIINIYHKRLPAIRQWHERVRRLIRRDKKLVNAWGRPWPVEFFRIDSELFRRGFSFLLQCCDDETEILTENGFEFFPDFAKRGVGYREFYPEFVPRVIQWVPETGELQLVNPGGRTPVARFASFYTGKMLKFESDYVSQLVTPNHKIGYFMKGCHEFHVDYAENLQRLSEFDIPCVTGNLQRLSEFDIPRAASQANGSPVSRATVKYTGDVDYSGFTYCVTVPSGFFVIRRHGKVSITGNSDIAAWLNMFGFKACHYWLKQHKMQSRIMLQEHDGLVLSCHPDEAYDVAVFLRDSLEQVWDCDGEPIWIPVEWMIGARWGEGIEMKQLPSRTEFENIVKEVCYE